MSPSLTALTTASSASAGGARPRAVGSPSERSSLFGRGSPVFESGSPSRLALCSSPSTKILILFFGREARGLSSTFIPFGFADLCDTGVTGSVVVAVASSGLRSTTTTWSIFAGSVMILF